ncbi:MAG: hypothetical protein M3326_11700, partial [Actinomycetota bacterium]|nr:hypothetical protein [Actinomycetota bacterium]
IQFGPGDRVVAEELVLPASSRRALQQQIMLFYTGVTRSANTILEHQTANVGNCLPDLHRLRDLAGEAADGLHRGEINAVAKAIRNSWEAKRRLANGVSTLAIDAVVEAALDAGALDAGASAAKISAAGGGGFVALRDEAGSVTGTAPGS